MGAGLSYVVLNILRVCSATILALVLLAGIIMLALQAKHDFGYFFFSIVNHFYLIVGASILLVSEVPLNFTTRVLQQTLPVLSFGYSLAWTGLPMLLLSCSILSSLRSAFYDVSNGIITQPLRSLVFAAGVASGIMGLLYSLTPLIYWRPGTSGGECRRLRKEGALVEQSSGSDTSSLELKPFAMQPASGPVISKPIFVSDPDYRF